MSTKSGNELLPDDIYHMDISDTTTDIVVTGDSSNALVRFYRYNGAFTADGTIPSFDPNHKAINNINSATYFAYFNGGDTKYKIIHELTKAVIELDLIPGSTFWDSAMVTGTQFLMV